MAINTPAAADLRLCEANHREKTQRCDSHHKRQNRPQMCSLSGQASATGIVPKISACTGMPTKAARTTPNGLFPPGTCSIQLSGIQLWMIAPMPAPIRISSADQDIGENFPECRNNLIPDVLNPLPLCARRRFDVHAAATADKIFYIIFHMKLLDQRAACCLNNQADNHIDDRSLHAENAHQQNRTP